MAIENDQVVSMSYELKDSNTKEIIDSNVGGTPLEFILGRGQIIPGLEEELKSMSEGESKDVSINAKDAYGEYNEQALQTLPKEQFAGIELTKGMSLYGQGEDGQTVQVTVKDFTDEEVTVDYNHPLAGKDLLFAVSVVGVRAATEDELVTGVVGGAASCGCGSGGCGEHNHEEEHECCGGEHKHDKDGECCGGEHHKDGGSCCGAH